MTSQQMSHLCIEYRYRYYYKVPPTNQTILSIVYELCKKICYAMRMKFENDTFFIL